MLTIQQIKNAKPTSKPRKLYDRDGLYLVVTSAGCKLWRGKYRVNGREKTLSLGRSPGLGSPKRAPWTGWRVPTSAPISSSDASNFPAIYVPSRLTRLLRPTRRTARASAVSHAPSESAASAT